MTRNRETLTHWLLQRGTAALMAPIVLMANVSTLISLNLLVFWHLHVGLEEIVADYIHHEVTRHLIVTLLRVLLLIGIKYAFVFFVL